MLQTEGELTKSHKAQCNIERKTKSRTFNDPLPCGGSRWTKVMYPFKCQKIAVIEKGTNGRGSVRLKPNRYRAFIKMCPKWTGDLKKKKLYAMLQLNPKGKKKKIKNFFCVSFFLFDQSEQQGWNIFSSKNGKKWYIYIYNFFYTESRTALPCSHCFFFFF